MIFDTLFNILSIMHEEFQIQGVDILTSRAAASMVPLDAGKLILESEISVLDQFKQGFPTKKLERRCLGKD